MSMIFNGEQWDMPKDKRYYYTDEEGGKLSVGTLGPGETFHEIANKHTIVYDETGARHDKICGVTIYSWQTPYEFSKRYEEIKKAK